jgi:hypothetical protein
MSTRLPTLLIALAATGPAAAAGVDGDWKIDGSINGVVIDITCTLKQSDANVTGACRGKDITGELPLKGNASGKTVGWSYDINYQGQQLTVEYHGTLQSAAQMQGTIGVMGSDSGSFTAKKL